MSAKFQKLQHISARPGGISQIAYLEKLEKILSPIVSQKHFFGRIIVSSFLEYRLEHAIYRDYEMSRKMGMLRCKDNDCLISINVYM